MTRIMGKGVKLPYNRRCDFCKRPVRDGYFVKEGPTQGFFCSSICLSRATATMQAIKKEKGIK